MRKITWRDVVYLTEPQVLYGVLGCLEIRYSENPDDSFC